jgi:hypothetical protein
MKRTTTVALAGAALLTAAGLSACGTTPVSDSLTREQQREEYENTLRLWLKADAEEKAAACAAVGATSDEQASPVRTVGFVFATSRYEGFDEEFLTGRC